MSGNTSTIKIAIDVNGKTGITTIRQIGKESKEAGEKSEKAFRGSGKSLGEFDNAAESAVLGIGKLSAAFTGLAATAALGGFVVLLKDGIESLAEWERRMLRTESLIKATGNAAGFTAEELGAFAKELDLATLGDRDEIMDAINAMQTFRDVTGQTFERAIMLSSDLAEVLGTGLRSQVVQLGKALQDPVQGISALQRVGVSFTDAQKDMIKELVESNQKLEAQARILDEIDRQVGGSAEGAAGGLAGKMDTLNFRWREFKETLSESSVINVAAEAITGLTAAIEFLNGRLANDTIADAIEKEIRQLEGLIAINKRLGDSAQPGFLEKLEARLEAIRDIDLAHDMDSDFGHINDGLEMLADKSEMAEVAVKELEKGMAAMIKTMAETNNNVWDSITFDIDYGGYDDLTTAIKAAQEAENNRRIDLKKSIGLQNALSSAIDDTYDIDAGIDSFTQQMSEMNAEFQAMTDSNKNIADTWADKMRDAFTGWASDYSRTLNDMLWESELTFDGILTSFAKMMTQMAIQESMTGIAGYIGTLFASAQGNVFSGNGITAYENRILDRPTVIPLAQGAALAAEAGRSEAVMPLVRTSSGDLGVQATGAAPTVTINFENKYGPDLEPEARIIRQSMGQVIANVTLKRKVNSRSWRQGMGINR